MPPSARHPAARPALFCLLTLALCLTGCAPHPKIAAWVVRYDIETPAEVHEICRTAQETGLNRLLVQVRGRADAFYRSDLAPAPEPPAEVPAEFDPLAATLAACAPLEVEAWLNVFFLWGDTTPPLAARHPLNRDPGMVLRDADGRSVAEYSEEDRARGWIEGVYADPASAAYRRLFVQVVEELIRRYPVTGIHLDFVRYPGADYGQSGELGERFRARWGFDPRLLPKPLLAPDLDTWLRGEMAPGDRVLATAALLWAAMRAEAVTELVREVRAALAEAGRPLSLSAAVLADGGKAYLKHGQDWQGWIDQGLVNALYPMAYFGGPDRVGGQLRDVALAQRPQAPIRLWAGLGAYIKEPAEIGREAATAAGLGYDGISLFSLGHLLARPAGAAPYLAAVRTAGTRRPRPAPV